MNRPSRCLEYAGVDAAWEARELRAFSGPQSAIRSAHTVTNYLLGRLLEEDLHVSCTPMLPANIQAMNGSMLQGTCLLQVVDVVNIGANFEHRTEDAKGPTRTLKLCLTDGHQIVFGFEYTWIPTLTVKTPRGTKVLVQNVAVRHGVIMLTPETCQVLCASGNDTLDVSRLQSSAPASTGERPSGAYSAALMTAGANLLAHKTTNEESSTAARSTPTSVHKTAQVSPDIATATSPRAHNNLPRTAAELIGSRFTAPPPPPAAPVRGLSNSPPTSRYATNAATPPASRQQVFSPPRRKPDAVTPAVFVDISSEDDDTASDATDPMVEHLFYSPNTPRIQNEPRNLHQQPSRKRPHPESSRSRATPPPVVAAALADVVDMTASPPLLPTIQHEQSEPNFSILSTAPPPPPRINLQSPFVYFNSQTPSLTTSSNSTHVGSILTIRCFMKSVAGFQFNTGVYNLRVLIEDGTATKDVQVDPALVESLMGVSCSEFAKAMQSSTPTVAHRLAAKMQVTLMTMQGIMRLRLDAAPDRWTLMQCREYSHSETHALLARVRHYAPAEHGHTR